MRILSEAFADGGAIPQRYAARAAGGDEISPPLTFEDVPSGTVSLALTVIDRHPVAADFVHWVVLGLPAETTSLPEGASGNLPGEARELTGTSGTAGWHGPGPPPGSGPHPYEFVLWALAAEAPGLPSRPQAAELMRALSAASVAAANMTGTYER